MRGCSTENWYDMGPLTYFESHFELLHSISSFWFIKNSKFMQKSTEQQKKVNTLALCNFVLEFVSANS